MASLILFVVPEACVHVCLGVGVGAVVGMVGGWVGRGGVGRGVDGSTYPRLTILLG